jgi:hypothetical protein
MGQYFLGTTAAFTLLDSVGAVNRQTTTADR